MSDALERAIDEMADELSKMGKAMDRDSKRIEKLEAENQRLREALETEGKHVAGRDKHIQKRDAEISELQADNQRLREALRKIDDCVPASIVREIAREALRQEGGADDE